MPPYSTAIAYLLWFLSGLGAMGLHRFYLGRIGTGLIWLGSGGLFLVGGISDFFRIPAMVTEANLRRRYHLALLDEADLQTFTRPTIRRESVETTILRTARRNKGMVTPGEVALAGDIPIEKAKQALDRLAGKGFAELKVRKSGVIVYAFPEFFAESGGFEDL